VRYLRVSSTGQVDTDYNPEGISLPAQRKACIVRERELNSPNTKEFIDPGRSAKSIDQRPDFQDMLTYLKTHPNVRYVSVYALSRTARNRYDDAIMMMQLEKLGVTLVSATERNLDDTPAGRAMHGMLAVFNQYQVDVSGEDIKYKMGQKVTVHGGTIGRARIGYQNVTEEFEGLRINTIAVDHDREGYVVDAFTLFATDEYTETTLHEELVARGFTSPKTLKVPERPVGRATIGKLLRDRYYLGEVNYKGQWYPGRHEPLITPELFDRVQRVLDSHSGSGARSRKFNHYLKGIFWCGRCGKRLVFQRAKGNGGVYYYFACSGQRHRRCDQPYVLAEELERKLERYYARVRLTEEFRQEVTGKVDDTLLDELAVQARIKTRLSARLKELDKQEDRYVDQLGDPAWDEDKLKAKVAVIRKERASIQAELGRVEHGLEAGRDLLTSAITLLKQPQELYRQCAKAERRLLTLTIFDKLFVNTYEITGHQLKEPFDALVSVQGRYQAAPEQPERPVPTVKAYHRTVGHSASWGDLDTIRDYQTDNRGTVLTDDAPVWDELSTTDLLALSLQVNGSFSGVMVGTGSFEPPASRL
jgi:DNA invertase Pin-like site-specific DNA recombinase